MKAKNKKIFLVLGALVLAYIGLRFYQERTRSLRGQDLVDNYRFYQAMDYYDSFQVESEEEALRDLYTRSNANPQVGAYLKKKGYRPRQAYDPGQVNLDSISLETSGALESQDYYELLIRMDQEGQDYSSLLDYDFRKLDFFQKLNLLGLVREAKTRQRIQDSLATNLTEIYYESTGKSYYRENKEENDYGFFEREMEDRSINSYQVYYSFLRDYRDIVLGLGSDNETYIYSIDTNYSPKYLGSFTGRPEGEGLYFREGLLIGKKTMAMAYSHQGQSYLLSMVQAKAGIDLSLSPLGDDRVLGDFVESRSLDKKIPLGPGRLEVSYNTGSPGVFYRIYTVYDNKDQAKSMIVAQYQVDQLGKILLKDLRQAI